MKIIILGAGQVGASVAKNLAGEANDITVVDHNEKLLQTLQNHLDIRVVHGHASHPDVLLEAGAENADMLLAVTNSDETNMIACQVAFTLFRTPTKIARVRDPNYLRYPELFSQESLAIDVRISPEELVTQAIQRLIDYPDTLQVLEFAGGQVQLVAMKAFHGGPLVGHALRTLHEHLPGVESRVVAIYRGGQAIIPHGSDVIQVDDEVFFIAATEHVRQVMKELRQQEKPVRRVTIGGGGNIGKRLAQLLEKKNCQVNIIEQDVRRCDHISGDLHKTMVLEGDIVDEEFLQESRIGDTDVFCALTNDDQINILSAMLAKRLGVRQVIALINRVGYVDLVESSNIDIAISPQQVTIGTLLTHVRRGDVVAVHSLRHGAAEAIEAVAHGDSHTSKVVGRRIEEIKLPPGTTICAIVRGGQVLMARHNTVVQAEDHVILFLTDKNRVQAVERLFQVSLMFF